MNDALLVREREAASDALRDLQRTLGRQRPVGVLYRALVLAEVEDADDVRVRTEATHRLRLAGDALAAYVIEALRLDEGERHVAVEELIVGEVDALLAAFAEELADPVAASSE